MSRLLVSPAVLRTLAVAKPPLRLPLSHFSTSRAACNVPRQSQPLVPVATAAAPAPAGPYSQAVRAHNLLYVSGQLPLVPSTAPGSPPVPVPATAPVREHARQALANLAAVLTAGGSGMDRVVTVRVYVAELAHVAEINGAYAEGFGPHRPARTLVQVAGLPMGALLEIDAVAVVD